LVLRECLSLPFSFHGIWNPGGPDYGLGQHLQSVALTGKETAGTQLNSNTGHWRRRVDSAWCLEGLAPARDNAGPNGFFVASDTSATPARIVGLTVLI
jgi:hypothetical protein